jgi:hypothetical protein
MTPTPTSTHSCTHTYTGTQPVVFLSLASSRSRGVPRLQPLQVTFGLPPKDFNLHRVTAWHVLLLRSSAGGLEGGFPGMGSVNSAVLIMVMQVFRFHIGLGSFGCTPGGSLHVSSGVSLFGRKRNLRPASHHDFRGSSWHRVCASVTAWRNVGEHLRLSAWVRRLSPDVIRSPFRGLRFIPWSRFSRAV